MRSLSLLLFLAFFSSPLLGNTKYFQAVQRTAKAYRVDVSIDQMKMVPDTGGNEAFYINLKSNRNNFEMVMLVGYIAAGEAMKTGVEPSVIYVTVEVPLGEGIRLVTTATREDVKRLISGDINTAQFSRLITYI
ncbi:MAG: hypothetical protein ACE5LH_08500 [Fidelibacterota bacterium]